MNCEAIGCARAVPSPRAFACSAHWKALPKQLRRTYATTRFYATTATRQQTIDALKVEARTIWAAGVAAAPVEDAK